MLRIQKVLSVVLLMGLLSMTLATPAYAFDGREGQKVIVAAGEVVNDDLYVGATEFVLDGTVNGDVFAGGRTITINGTVTGNLLAAGNTVIVNGTVNGSVLAAGSVLFIGEKAKIGKDILAAGYSLEVRKRSAVARDAVAAGGQILLGGDVGRNVKAATGGLQIDGTIGGNVNAAVGEANQAQSGPPPAMFMGQSTVPIPNVKQGLSLDPAAKIQGTLDYTQNSDLSFPAGVVQGKITRLEPPKDEGRPTPQQTAEENAGQWALKALRSLITLILIGLLLIWLLPTFLKSISDHLTAKPWPSLGWGVVAYAGFFFLLLLVLFVMILGAVLFGILTLGGISGTIVWVGILILFALILGFVLATSFIAKIAFGMTIGKWILSSGKSPLAEHKFWPMVIGVAITVVVFAVLTFPLIPGLLGGLLEFVIVLFGLGALWLWGRDLLQKKPAAAA